MSAEPSAGSCASAACACVWGGRPTEHRAPCRESKKFCGFVQLAAHLPFSGGFRFFRSLCYMLWSRCAHAEMARRLRAAQDLQAGDA